MNKTDKSLKTVVKSEDKNNIKCLKTIMMLCVVMFHSCVFYSGNWFTVVQPVDNAHYITIFADFLNSFQTQAFTMASGYLFFYLRYEKGKYNNFKKDVKRRFIRLIIPYMVMCIIWAIPIHIYFYGFDWKEIINKYVLGISPDQLWFLWMLFWCFCLFHFLADRVVFSFPFLVPFTILSMFGALLSTIGVLSIFQINTSIRYCVFFYFGGYIYIHRWENFSELKKKKLIIFLGICGFLLWYIWEYTSNFDSILIKVFHTTEKSITSIVLVAFLYVLITLVSNNLSIESLRKKIYEKIAADSFGIYLFHQQVIYFIIVWLNGNIHPILVVLISYILALFTSDIIVTILRKTPLCRILSI